MSDTIVADAEVTQAVENIPAGETHPVREIFRPHPGMLSGILVTVLSIVEDDSKANELEVLFLTVKRFVQQTTREENPETVLSVIFAYYIESHRALSVMRKKANNEDNSADPQYLKLYNEAALSIFDLYLVHHRDFMVRRAVPLAANALHEIVAAHQASDESKPMKDVLSYLSTVALLSQSVKDYVRGRRRLKNFDYIAWLKDFYIKVLSTNDLSFMKDDAILKFVLTQVTDHAKAIEIPPKTIN